MKDYQDTETGSMWAFEDDIDPLALKNRNIPITLSAIVKYKPDDSYVWHKGDWTKQELVPPGYTQPISSVPAYNPAWMAYLSPYSAIHLNEGSALNISLEQINNNSYNGKKLAEVVATLPINTKSGLPALISYDGAIAIPQCEDFPTNADGTSKLNEILCCLLLGGIHTEILHLKELEVGFLIDQKELFGGSACIHTKLRHNWASIVDRISPLRNPNVLMVSDIKNSYSQGLQVLKAIPKLSPFFILNGYTAMVYRNNNDALNNLWITVEQITENLWTKLLTRNRKTYSDYLRKCDKKTKQGIDNDHIWAKQKTLQTLNIISQQCHTALKQARIKRNNLVHKGIGSDLQTIEELWNVLAELIEVASGMKAIGVRKLKGSGTQNWTIPARTNFDEWAQLATKLSTAAI